MTFQGSEDELHGWGVRLSNQSCADVHNQSPQCQQIVALQVFARVSTYQCSVEYN
jgi:hypothetical protein